MNLFTFLAQSLTVSRPALWGVTVWLYVVSVAPASEQQHSIRFWAGLAFCTWPLNLLVYAFNDLDDGELDRRNPRKAGYGVGGRADNAVLRHMSLFAAVLVVLSLGTLLNHPMEMVLSWVVILGSNWLYNLGPRWREGPPPLDLILPLSYLWVLWFGPALNHTRAVP